MCVLALSACLLLGTPVFFLHVCISAWRRLVLPGPCCRELRGSGFLHRAGGNGRCRDADEASFRPESSWLAVPGMGVGGIIFLGRDFASVSELGPGVLSPRQVSPHQRESVEPSPFASGARKTDGVHLGLVYGVSPQARPPHRVSC